ncbi:MAG: HAD-IC family P-type ATPase [Eubacterium sp.]|nr:HAD-IC family P-type ATPase [Eubacterium sp.]
MSIQGLTTEEVERLEREGKTNKLPNESSKTVASIIAGNVFTYFNAIFFGLAVLVIMVGAYRNLTFMAAVIANMFIGIIQQLRAKKELDKLSLLDVTEYSVIRNGEVVKTSSDKLVLGDCVMLSAGQQVPADAEVVDGKASVNESLLTGEADEIEKEEGSSLMSGSFVVSGECTAKLVKVGTESYAAQLTAKAKEVKQKKSEMIRDIEKIILIAGIIIMPVGIMMVINSVLINGRSLQDGVVSMVGAVVGMIPEGFYLLLTMALTMSAAKLATKKVLLHDMKSIETLARVDVLCVDKTGTITSEVMSVTDVFLPYGANSEVKLEEKSETEAERKSETEDEVAKKESKIKLLTQYVNIVPDTNITMVALRDYLNGKTSEGDRAGEGVLGGSKVTEVIAFSSKLKYSEINTETETYRFGAPEFILSKEQLDKNKELIERYTGVGQRVLAFAETQSAEKKSSETQSKDVCPILFVSMANEIRETAPETFSYFKEQGVKIKVISGDNPLTVSKVAGAAQIEDAEMYVDASTLEKEEDYIEAVKKYTVFGRVKPEQKKELIDAIKKNGQKVAMTGDGVNDILAMKEADCSIAMGGGSDAARQAAQVVLLDSDFSRMMDIVSEGRRTINNMTRSGTLFLYKNIFSFSLALFTIIFMLQYPIKPTQIALISMFNIGAPGFLLAIENNTKRQRGRLLTRTLKGSIPAAIFAFIATVVLMYAGPKFGLTEDEMGVAGTYLLSVMGYVLLWRLIHPLNKFRIAVFVVSIIGMVLSIVVLWSIFIMAVVTFKGTLISIGYALACALILWLMSLKYPVEN